jgi:ribonucleoside-diphosphate reductase alpha chain
MVGNDAFAGALKSGGATRNAAKMVVLDMDHPDVLETRDGRPGFIRSKAVEEKLAHDLVKIGYSVNYDDPNGAYKRVRFQNGNHSVSIPDSFMQAAIDDGVWKTLERRSGKVVHSYKARDLWREVAEAAWTCGDPGVQFTDTINRWHTTPKSGRINASNPCSEFLHVDNTACNLCALNLTKFFDGRVFNLERFRQATRVFSVSQMAIVAKAEYPTDAITKNSHKLRPIGTNFGDLGALLMKLGYGYDSDEGRSVAARMASFMTAITYATSAKVAARVGAFHDFEKNRDDMLRIMRMHQEADSRIVERWGGRSPIGDDVVSQSAEAWREAVALGERYGYNISQATLQAPLGTISFLMEMSTTGIEPAIALVSYKSLVGGGAMKLVPSCVRESLVNLGYADDQVTAICKHIERTDTIEGAEDLKDEHLPMFDCALPSGDGVRYLTPMAHIKMMSAIQPLITCAQSKTVNLPRSATVEDIADIYRESWRLGIKCVALYRDGCKASQPVSTRKDSDDIDPDEGQDPAPRLAAVREKMPTDVPGWRHKFTIDGYSGYLQVNEYPDGRPGEMFVKLGKSGSTTSGLIDGFAKLFSISIQHGVPLPGLISSFVDTRFEPAGITNNPDIRLTNSLYDYIFKYLDVKYHGGEHSGLAERIAGRAAQSLHPESLNEGISRSVDSDFSIPAAPLVPSVKAVSRKSLDAPPCGRCGAITQRNGSCYLCPGCGQTTGCS